MVLDTGTPPSYLELMKNTETMQVAEALRITAEAYGEVAFAHVCTAALAGEGWASERIAPALTAYEKRASKHWHAKLLRVIRATDTTRPDGATPRTLTEV